MKTLRNLREAAEDIIADADIKEVFGMVLESNPEWLHRELSDEEVINAIRAVRKEGIGKN